MKIKCSHCGLEKEKKRTVVRAVDSHNNLVEYFCNECKNVTVKLENIEDGAYEK